MRDFAELDHEDQMHRAEWGQRPPPPMNRKAILAGALRPLSGISADLSSQYIVKGWLNAGTFSVIYGEPNVGKTFLALDIAFHVAAGEAWHGNRVRGGPVIYLASEGGHGIELRIEAFRHDRPDMAAAIEDAGTFHLLPVTIDLCPPGDAEALADVFRSMRPSLVVVDTLARSMGSGDENTAKDMGALIRNLDFIRAETGAHVMAIHHCGKDASRGARGSGSLRGAVDHEIELTREGAVMTAENKKERDGPSGRSFAYSLRSVLLGCDEDGDEVSSCVVEASEAPVARGPKITGQAKIALQAFGDALAHHGEVRHEEMFPPGVQCVSLDRWREYCDRHHLSSGESDSAKRKAFHTAKNALKEKSVIGIIDNYAWRVN
ncbi:MAG: AAA family ATPase [Pseudooceanicola nanhaiensis]